MLKVFLLIAGAAVSAAGDVSDEAEDAMMDVLADYDPANPGADATEAASPDLDLPAKKKMRKMMTIFVLFAHFWIILLSARI